MIFEGRGGGFLGPGGIEVSKTWVESSTDEPPRSLLEGSEMKPSIAANVNELTNRAAFLEACSCPVYVYHLAVGLFLQRLEDASSMQLDCLCNAT